MDDKCVKISELDKFKTNISKARSKKNINSLYLVAEGLIDLELFDDIEALKNNIVQEYYTYNEISEISESLKNNKNSLFVDDTLFWAKMLINNSYSRAYINRLLDKDFLMDENKILELFNDIEKLSPNIFLSSKSIFNENGICSYPLRRIHFYLLDNHDYSETFIDKMVGFDDFFIKYKKFENLTKEEYIKKYTFLNKDEEKVPEPKKEWLNDDDFCFKFLQNVFLDFKDFEIPNSLIYNKNIINKAFISNLTQKIRLSLFNYKETRKNNFLKNIKNRKMEKYILKMSPICILHMRDDTINNKGLVMYALKRLSKLINTKEEYTYSKYMISILYENLKDLKYDEDIIKLTLSLNNAAYTSLPKEIQERKDIIDMVGKKYGAYRYFFATIDFEKGTENGSNFIIDNSFIQKISYDRLFYSQLDKSIINGYIDEKTPKELKELLIHNHKLISFYTINSVLTEDEIKNHFIKYPLDLQYFDYNVHRPIKQNIVINKLIQDRQFILRCAINNPKIIYYIKNFFEINDLFVIRLLKNNPEAISNLKEQINKMCDEDIISIYKKTKDDRLLKYINDEAFEKLVLTNKVSLKNIKNNEVKKRFKKTLKGLDNDCFIF
mgnify:CR=1 FL=1